LTDRRAAEESLRISQEQFRLLVQGVTDYAIYMLSPSGEIVSWNVGAERIKGYSADEVLGTHFSRFYTASDQAAGEPAHALAVAAKEGRFEKEGQRVRKDGTLFWANVVIDTLRAPDGSMLGFAKITRDVTSQRESQKALDDARETLFQAQKMEAIGQLTGGVAHDFNNLLMVIKGSLELLRKRITQDPRALHLLENAQLGANRGMALTQRMLAFARRQELRVSAVDIPALVVGMTDLLTRSLDSKVELELRFPLKLPSVLADSNQLELALLNLVVNARDAMLEHHHRRQGSHAQGRAVPRTPCVSVGDGFGRGYGCGHPRPRHGAVLHDQGHRQGHGARPAHGSRGGSTVGRSARVEQREGAGNHGGNLAALCIGHDCRRTHSCYGGGRTEY
jgi:PAS domain S-box-containing protein